MVTTLEYLYEMLVAPGSEGRPTSPEYAEKGNAYYQRMEDFLQSLEKARANELEDIVSDRADIAGMEARQAFVVGFRLGARAMLEVLQQQ